MWKHLKAVLKQAILRPLPEIMLAQVRGISGLGTTGLASQWKQLHKHVS